MSILYTGQVLLWILIFGLGSVASAAGSHDSTGAWLPRASRAVDLGQRSRASTCAYLAVLGRSSGSERRVSTRDVAPGLTPSERDPRTSVIAARAAAAFEPGFRLLGNGGEGMVYAGTLKGETSEVVVKFPFSQVDGKETYFPMQDIPKILAAVQATNHPGKKYLPAWAKVGRDSNGEFLVMPFTKGRPLSELAKTMTPSQVVGSLIKIGKGLDAVAAAGISHGDPKEHNVIIQDNGDPMIIDFGFSKELGAIIPGRYGTPEYMREQDGPMTPVTPGIDATPLARMAGKVPVTGPQKEYLQAIALAGNAYSHAREVTAALEEIPLSDVPLEKQNWYSKHVFAPLLKSGQSLDRAAELIGSNPSLAVQFFSGGGSVSELQRQQVAQRMQLLAGRASAKAGENSTYAGLIHRDSLRMAMPFVQAQVAVVPIPEKLGYQ